MTEVKIDALWVEAVGVEKVRGLFWDAMLVGRAVSVAAGEIFDVERAEILT